MAGVTYLLVFKYILLVDRSPDGESGLSPGAYSMGARRVVRLSIGAPVLPYIQA